MHSPNEPYTVPDDEIDDPPVLGSWRNMYIVVLVLHLLLLLGFYFFSRAYTV